MVTSSSWYWQKFIEAPGNPVLLRRGGIGAVVEWGSMPPKPPSLYYGQSKRLGKP